MLHTPVSTCTRRGCNHCRQHVPALGCASQALSLGANTARHVRETCPECSCPDAVPALVVRLCPRFMREQAGENNSLEEHRHPCGLVHPLPAGLSGCVIVRLSARSLPPVSASTFPCQNRVSPPPTLCNSFPVPASVPPASVTRDDSENRSSIQRGTATAPESAESSGEGETQRPGMQRNVCPRRGAARSERLVRAGLRCGQPRRGGCPRLHSELPSAAASPPLGLMGFWLQAGFKVVPADCSVEGRSVGF